MFWFKSCPKCHGDLHRDLDEYGTFVSCLQCGMYLTQIEESQEILSRVSPRQPQVLPIELEPITA